MASSKMTLDLDLSKLRRQLEAIARHAAALAQELAEIDQGDVVKQRGIKIHLADGKYVAADGGGWIPGAYDTPEAAQQAAERG